ncbi:MAG: 8-oxo-dGTP pyrophosphatase MutT (NUDIX family) [Oceanicoccus sp.]|jgi:8-oxo-dGTP pyrophosphatase MutT (NUDIX family)
MCKIFPAATVVLIRDSQLGPEILLLRRSTQVSFAKGSWVFPGGRIDREDYRDDMINIESAARFAAVRETLEETQLNIVEQDLNYFAHWTTPPGHNRRYATWFYMARVNNNTEKVVVDNSEIVDYCWYRPEQALADYRAKLIEMMPPTVVTLSELCAASSSSEAIALFKQRPVTKFLPKFSKTEQGIVMLYPGDAGYQDADSNAADPRNRLWMLDEAWRYEKSS